MSTLRIISVVVLLGALTPIRVLAQPFLFAGGSASTLNQHTARLEAFNLATMQKVGEVGGFCSIRGIAAARRGDRVFVLDLCQVAGPGYPSRLIPRPVQERMVDAAERLVRGLGIRQAQFNIELFSGASWHAPSKSKNLPCEMEARVGLTAQCAGRTILRGAHVERGIPSLHLHRHHPVAAPAKVSVMRRGAHRRSSLRSRPRR